MTRFARAKGSKSSNEKAPEDSTPWEVMKDQLLRSKKENEESKKREEAENQRIENYQNFMKEQKVQKKKAVWCDFPETASSQPRSDGPPKKKKKKEHKKEVPQDNSNDIDSSKGNTEMEVDTPPQKKKTKHKKVTQHGHSATEVNAKNTSSETNNTETPQEINDNKPKKKKKNKKNKKPVNPNESNQSESGQAKPPQQSQNVPGKNNIRNNNKNPQKKKKLVDGKPVRRKEIDDRSFQLIINGKEVELVRFDGFPVMKRDAERLQELKNNMIKKGIPKSEVQRTMKLERRRAEKALARMKRDVCYNCRKGGHNLSDCPELKSKIPGVDAPEGLCFKCGSTEHKQFECKVNKETQFKFATCFICKEPGHIARQCPDNPKGLYPNGGGCKLCGDVTHLRKDCPTVKDKKEESSIKLATLEDDNIEDIGVKSKTSNVELAKKPKKIRF